MDLRTKRKQSIMDGAVKSFLIKMLNWNIRLLNIIFSVLQVIMLIIIDFQLYFR
jgi:hypothetical protein